MRTDAERRSRRWPLWALAVIVAGAVVGVVLWRQSGRAGCSGVEVSPSDDAVEVVNRDDPRMTFCFGEGTHTIGDPLVPQDGDRFLGAGGAVLTGDDRTGAAIAGTASDVLVKGFVVEHFDSQSQSGAIESKGSEGWVIEDNEVRFNAAAGITVGSSGIARDNYVHHNGQLGIRAPSSVDTLIEGNELSFNNPDLEFNPGFDAGGAKFANTEGLVLRDNYVHDNRGNGLWLDIDNVDALIEDNRVEDNEGQGIFYEIGYDAVIRDNVVRNNTRLRDGQEACNLFYGAGILVAHSSGVEVYNNLVESNCNGIGGIQQDRGGGDLGAHLLEDLYVHDNRIVMTEGQSGVAQPFDSAPDAFDDSRSNRFENNTYVVDDASGEWWAWAGDNLTWSQWNAAGHDAGGAVEDGA